MKAIKGSLHDLIEWGAKEEKMIKEDAKTVEEFVQGSYWENPEDAIGDIRKFITQNPIPQEIFRIRDEWGSNWTDHAPYYIETLLNWIFKGGKDEKDIL